MSWSLLSLRHELKSYPYDSIIRLVFPGGKRFSEFSSFVRNNVTEGGGRWVSFFNCLIEGGQSNGFPESFLKYSLILYLINFAAFSIVPFLFYFITTWFKFSVLTIIYFFRSSRSQMFFKIGALKNLAIFTWKHLTEGLQPYWKQTLTQVFSCECNF